MNDHGSNSGQHDAKPFGYDRTFDLAQQKVIFNPIGQYAVDVTFLHVELKVPFGHYPQLFQDFQDDVKKAYDIAQEVGKQNKDIKKSTISGLSALTFPVKMAAFKFTETLFKLPEVTLDEARFDPLGRYRRGTSTEPVSEEQYLRQKRFVEAAVGAGASILGFIFDIFKYQEVKAIKKDLYRMEKTQQVIYDRQKMLMQTTIRQGELLVDHTQWIKGNRDTLRALIAADQAAVFTKLQVFGGVISREVDTFADTVKMAQLGKLNPDQISLATLNDIVQFIQTTEEEFKLTSPVKKAADIFTMPLSYLYNLEEERLEFIIHVPMTRQEQILDMYEYFPFPMTMTSDRDRVAVPRTGNHNVLAYNKQREYQTLSATELQACFKLKQVHYCAHRQILRTDWTKTCLSALYTKNQAAATRYCDFQIQPADERVYKLQGSDFLVYTNRELLAERICGNRHDSVQIREGTIVSVPQGCRLKLEQHQIYGEVGIHRGFESPKIFDWTWDAQRVLRNHSGPELASAIQAMEHEAGMSSFETEDLLQQMDLHRLQKELEKTKEETLEINTSLNNPFGLVHWIAAILSSITTFVSTLIVIKLALWFQARRAMKPTAPPMPASINYQPAIQAPTPHVQFISAR